jgi:hypothetical protein
MVKLLRELAVVLGGATLGVVLLLLSGNYLDYVRIDLEPVAAWGFPLPWHSSLETLGSRVTTMFGLQFPGSVDWFAFGVDLVFWSALTIAVLEASSRFAFPYVMHRLRSARLRHSVTSAV